MANKKQNFFIKYLDFILVSPLVLAALEHIGGIDFLTPLVSWLFQFNETRGVLVILFSLFGVIIMISRLLGEKRLRILRAILIIISGYMLYLALVFATVFGSF